jgi:hypothetical protein
MAGQLRQYLELLNLELEVEGALELIHDGSARSPSGLLARGMGSARLAALRRP